MNIEIKDEKKEKNKTILPIKNKIELVNSLTEDLEEFYTIDICLEDFSEYKKVVERYEAKEIKI